MFINISKQRGFSAVEIFVFVLIVLIIAAIAIPKLLESHRIASEEGKVEPPKRIADEAAAVQTLRVIARANATYRLTKGGGKYGTFDDLREADLLDATYAGERVEKGGYVLTASVTPSGTGFCASAVPTGAGAYRSFGIDDKGLIYSSPANGAPAPVCLDGILRTNGAETLP